MKNLILKPVLLPTEEASHLYIQNSKLCYDETIVKSDKNCGDHHLYLTSEAEIKEGDFFMNGHLIVKCIKREGLFAIDEKGNKHFAENGVSFTTDPKLIADGVPAIDGNTKAIIKFNGYMILEGIKVKFEEVNFLTEFCKRWNQKDNQKVDVEKFDIGKLAQQEWSRRVQKSIDCEFTDGVIFGYNQAIQSQAGGFSLEYMRNLLERFATELKLVRMFDDGNEEEYRGLTTEDINTFVRKQSLTKESQSKGDIIIECETMIIPKSNMSTKGVGEEFSGYEERIKLNKDGQPIIHFK